MKTKLAIGDIHGRLDLLNALLEKIDDNYRLDNVQLIFLGDMINRGKDSRGVIARIKGLQEKYPETVVLAGNHEWLAIDAMIKNNYDDLWLWNVNGGIATKNSYRYEEDNLDQGALEEDIKWMACLPLYYETDDFFFSHAPLPIDRLRRACDGPPYTACGYSRSELTWTYFPDEDDCAKKIDGKVGVCGHVHQLKLDVFEPRIYDHYIFCDSGSGCSPKAPLSAVDVAARTFIQAWPAEAIEVHTVTVEEEDVDS